MIATIFPFTSLESRFYEVNSISYQGEMGLAVLNQLDTLSAVIVTARIKFNPLRFEAEHVYAGSNLDLLQGSVVSRCNNIINIQIARFNVSQYPVTTAIAVRGLVTHFGSAPLDFRFKTLLVLPDLTVP